MVVVDVVAIGVVASIPLEDVVFSVVVVVVVVSVFVVVSVDISWVSRYDAAHQTSSHNTYPPPRSDIA